MSPGRNRRWARRIIRLHEKRLVNGIRWKSSEARYIRALKILMEEVLSR